MKGQPNCYFCGKFVPYLRNYTWTFYGGTLDFEPPDECWAHIECFEKEGIPNNICWIKPYKRDEIIPSNV